MTSIQNPNLTIHTLDSIIGRFERRVVNKGIAFAQICLGITCNLVLSTRNKEYFWFTGKLPKYHECRFDHILVHFRRQIANEKICSDIQRLLIHI